MKNLKIWLLLMFFVLTGAQLSATENVMLENDQPLTAKTAQADTVRMTWDIYDYKSFYFNGEEGATYKVDWGDGKTDTYTGKGVNSQVSCFHSYSKSGTYTVLLYGVTKNE
ncbi:MAG: PKD domain-containing protein [Bacteroides sp.]|nr:PKD domain-containing protein [Ruminococcus flavefaciens]MCM1554309.1 PKD domain-containing protein [Bacteroides sp.]